MTQHESLAPSADGQSNARPLSLREEAIGYGIVPFIGLLFVIGMHLATTALWPFLTLLLAFTLFFLSLIVPVFRLRYNVASLSILPFCSYVVNNFDVGYGRTYTAPGIAMILATLLFIVVVGVTILIKALLVAWANDDTQAADNHPMHRSGGG
ncbi:hypothetical protein Poly51_62200 [Rubripirellula tenax]|uniref:Uncharacterized protein n=1 Tax=Rubripirellula tenax TaxID=2528015 RepID=A0A5C6E468_9BACT|nr:hypothetical protein [Rubripirellula tenax]TWU43698.1 hypothetical protein Poly51_62200 [Rubripirellula tenax]